MRKVLQILLKINVSVKYFGSVLTSIFFTLFMALLNGMNRCYFKHQTMTNYLQIYKAVT